MKNFNTRLLFLLVASLFIVPACNNEDPNEELNNDLIGDWDVESYTVDGQEAIGSVLISFKMEFKKETETGGETEWTLVDFLGATLVAEGDYVIINDGTEIDIDGEELNIRINNDNLFIDGNLDGDRIEIEAERD